MANNKDFKVKNGIKPAAYHEGVGTVTSTPGSYVINNAVYAEKSVDINPENDNPQGIWMREDTGTDFYLIGTGSGGDRIDQYTLSTAFDISTATSVAAKTLDVSPQTGVDPTDMFFKPDGTKLYVCDQQNVYQYALSSAWDLSTASFETGKTVYIGGQETSTQGVAFSADGTRMFIVGSNQDNVVQYNLSSAWDVSTASYSNNSLDISSETSTPSSIRFNDDGTKLFMSERTASAESILQYSLSTAYDVSTMSYDNISLDVSAQEGNPWGLAFGDNGTKIYVVGSTSDTVYQYTSGSPASLDLSTGSVFDYTPTSDAEITISNPAESGTVSQATLLLTTAETSGVADAFNITLASPSYGDRITTNFDLATDGGMLWLKVRNQGYNFHLLDTIRGPGKYISSSANNAEATDPDRIKAFYTDGFLLGSDVQSANGDMVYWSFKQKAGFFDVVTYTGNGGNNRSVSHNLGSAPGMMFIKRLDSATNWYVYHRSSYPNYTILNSSTSSTIGTGSYEVVGGSSVFYVGNASELNANGGNYVAYLFGHDTSAGSFIKCDKYTGNDSLSSNAVNVGFEPQFVIIKNSTSTGDWVMFDNKRGVAVGDATNDKYLFPNLATSEGGGIPIDFTSTGFDVGGSTSSRTNSNGQTYIYMAIGVNTFADISYDTSIQWPGGTAPALPADGETDVLTFTTSDGGTTYQGSRAIDGAK